MASQSSRLVSCQDCVGAVKRVLGKLEDRILEGRPSLEKSQIDFSEIVLFQVAAFSWEGNC
ncbi:hypothetical protein GBA52_010444 [Prunus armeniaca]|nr:hypothetical protein GBA52_010444 [Prunus armeniaca]